MTEEQIKFHTLLQNHVFGKTSFTNTEFISLFDAVMELTSKQQPSVSEVRIKAMEYCKQEWSDDVENIDSRRYCRKDFIEGAEWFRSRINTKDNE